MGDLESARKPRLMRSFIEVDSFPGERNNEGTKSTFQRRRFGEGSEGGEGRESWEDYE